MIHEGLKIKMLKTVCPDGPFAKKGQVAINAQEYPAVSNDYGAICAITENGEKLGVRPGEFKFIEAPEWVLKIHGESAGIIGKNIFLSDLNKKIDLENFADYLIDYATAAFDHQDRNLLLEVLKKYFKEEIS